MKLIKYLIILLCICSIGLFIGCEEEDDNAKITATKQVIRINNNRTEIEVEGPITLVLSGAKLYKQRPSCSGFESCTASAIDIGDYAEYKYVNKEDSNYKERTINPYEIRFYRAECVDPTGDIGIVTLLDSDKDGVPDKYDAAPENPAVQ